MKNRLWLFLIVVLMTVSLSGQAFAVQGTFTNLTDIGTEANLSVASYNNELYILRYNVFKKYNPTTSTWTTLTNTPTLLFDSSLIAINGKLYAFGGTTSYTSTTYTQGYLYEYNPSTNSWVTKTTGPRLKNAEVAVINNEMYIYGGADNNGSFKDNLWKYTPTTDTWTQLTTAVGGNSSSDIVSVNNLIFLMYSNSSAMYVKVFNPANNTWTDITTSGDLLPYSSNGGPDLFVVGTNIYCFRPTGNVNDLNKALYVFDTLSYLWTRVDLATPLNYPVNGSYINGKYYFFFNNTNPDPSYSDFYCYTLPTGISSLSAITQTNTTSQLSWGTYGKGKVVLTPASFSGAKHRIFIHDGYMPRYITTLNAGASWDSSSISLGKMFPSDSVLSSWINNTVSSNPFSALGTGVDLLYDAAKLYEKTVNTSLDASHFYRVYVQSISDVGEIGNTQYFDITLPYSADSSPPIGTVTINGGLSKTGSTDVTINVNASDPLVTNYTSTTSDDASGVKTVELSNDGINYDTPKTYTTGFSEAWTLESGPGTKKVYARIKDNAGNQIVTTATIYLADDTTGPAVNLLFNNGQTVTSNTSGTLTINAVDDYSDLSQLTMQASSDGITWKGYNGSSWVDNYVGLFRTTVPWSLSSGDGWKDIFVKVIDGQGNYIIKSIRVALSSPSASPTGNAGTSSTTTTTAIKGVDYQVLSTPQVQVVITGQSNITEISWSFDGLNFSPFETPLIASGNIQKDFTFSGSEGIKGLYFKYRNTYGQESNVNNLKFVVDTTPPEVKLTTAKGQAEGATSLSNIGLFVDVKDNISKSYQYSLDGGAWTNLPPNGIITKSGLTAGTKGTLYLIRVKVKDEAGNITEKSIKVYRLP